MYTAYCGHTLEGVCCILQKYIVLICLQVDQQCSNEPLEPQRALKSVKKWLLCFANPETWIWSLVSCLLAASAMAVADARNASVLDQEPHVLTTCHVEEDATRAPTGANADLWSRVCGACFLDDDHFWQWPQRPRVATDLSQLWAGASPPSIQSDIVW